MVWSKFRILRPIYLFLLYAYNITPGFVFSYQQATRLSKRNIANGKIPIAESLLLISKMPKLIATLFHRACRFMESKMVLIGELAPLTQLRQCTQRIRCTKKVIARFTK